jgi:YgiT-type zinc finger domain-containing protein
MNGVKSICPVCHFGKLQERKVTHTQIFQGRLIAIPNVPALVCDVCGEKILDDEVLIRLSGLLGQDKRDMGFTRLRHSLP